ncbi:beta-ketoacyl-[acyl-carrier-protein] synthase family protein [Streptomyces profundus]|uniref:beta-ketoacyl-[acyl-carrier-protein] synthase family protein n=1 Tax=Streptomyces profundus TaxID=2867410 RepID=UPI001D16C6AF|nr:beta-ketoacyl-[acyl-carrier-protein] synthase family protein [Streptomyces sp. MA3_2.13]UED88597.1 beta-ketoacyl-[acyl-carrier-protein] synthase family protein [Streptomyces sp. MA3_2.13]
MAVTTGYGQGVDALRAGIWSGEPAFVPVTRFDTSRYRVGIAAQADPGLELDTELRALTEEALKQAGLSASERADAPLVMARHADPAVSRLPRAEQESRPIGDTARWLSEELGLGGAGRTYINACVAASTAVAEAALLISSGRNDRVVVAAGHLVDAESFTTFNAGRALAPDGRLRPFSSGRKGLLLGDGAGAVVLEAVDSRTGMRPLAKLTGWGMAGDAHHVCQPHPRGLGMARAISRALDRAGLTPGDLDYVNAHGTGTPYNDAAETAALHRAFGEHAERVPVSSTKSMHGHALQAAGLVELVICLLALELGSLPVNSGYLGPDPDCRLDLVLDSPRQVTARHVLSLNAAFGGANTALVVSAA